MNRSVGGSPWSDDENNLIVADYLEMRRKHFAVIAYTKADHRRKLAPLLDGRTNSAIEFKHQNISYALETYLAQPFLPGYFPRANFQKSLVDAIIRCLDLVQDAPETYLPHKQNYEDKILSITSIPPILNQSPTARQHVENLIKIYDPADRDARNRKVGEIGERLVFQSAKSWLRREGRADLAKKVKWVSRDEGDGAGYDIRSFNASGAERFLEVKTTCGGIRTPFYITANERRISEKLADSYRVFRLFGIAYEPAAFLIKPPLENYVRLEPTTYRATLP